MGGATLSGVGVTAPAVKVGSTPATGSLGTVRLGAGVSERDTSAGGLFVPEDPAKVKNQNNGIRARREELVKGFL